MSTRWTEEEYHAYLAKRGQEFVADLAKVSKYRNVKTEVDGIVFDSGREAKRWGELQLLERAGAITELRRQVPYAFRVNQVTICTYKADFVYRENGREIVEDAKGKATDVYVIKRKLMKAFFGITILET